MRLKSLKLSGFKSYVDPTTIELTNNVNVIVGPNGCGKSNIVDAIRLVIGESQASNLRGDELADVIFEGTALRASTGQASIELLLDNHDHRIGGSYAKYAEILLKREIFRDSPSKFYLNGRRCRKKDIHDLFLGSGFGARSYSVIEQGFVGRIVTAKPEELRDHLEEVAGVSKYRERRRETEKKIHSTSENLERVRDHATELSRQISYLERQAREAARYSDLRDKERSIQAKLVVLQVLKVEKQIEEQEAQIRSSSHQVNQELAKRQSIRTKLDTLRVREADHLEQFNTIQGESFEARATLARIEEESRQRKQRCKDATLAQHEAEEAKTDQEKQLTKQKIEISKLRSSLSQIEIKRQNAEERCIDARKEFSTRQERVDLWRQDRDAFVYEFNNKSNALSVHLEQHSRVQKEIAELERRDTKLHEILTSHDQEDYAEQFSQQQNALEHELEGILQRAKELDDEIETLEQLDVQDEERRRLIEQDLREIRERRSAITAVMEQKLKRGSTKTLEGSASLHNLQERSRLGEVVSVQSGYEKAVEVVLNTYLHAITVDGSVDKDTVMAELQDSDVVLVEASTNMEIGPRLADVITNGREYVADLCSQVFVDENLDSALKRRKLLKPHESTVTKNGIWLGKSWIKFNGTSRNENTVMENRIELQELNELHDATEKTYQETLQNVSMRSQLRTQVREERRAVQQKQNSTNSLLSELRAQVEKHTLARFQENARLASAKQERETNTARKLNLEQELRTEESTISKLNIEIENLNKKKRQLETEEKQHNCSLSQALQEDRTAQAEFHQLDLDYNNTRAQISSFTLSSQILVKNLEELNHRLKHLKEQIQDNERAASNLATELQAAVKKSAEVDQQLANVRVERDAILQQIRDNNLAESKQQQRVDESQHTTQKLRETNIQLTSRLEHLQSELQSLDVDTAEARSSLSPADDEDSLARVLKRTQTRIDKLGVVNLAAARDLDSRKEEYETYQSRIQDLEMSQETLKQAMHKIDKETLVQFNDTFMNANEVFQKHFASLFGGGRAQLALTDDDPLAAGVYMLVQPPGKQIKNMNQLSDGEKALAALAFTFAMFELNPSPICVLDEVDAPLDSNNISRFGKLVHTMTNEVQFLIITHSRVTMNFAESLIGITMQEAGVSRVVSVDLE